MGDNGEHLHDYFANGISFNNSTNISQQSTNTSYTELEYGEAFFIIDVLIMAVGLVGNAWMIYFICQQKSRTTQNISIVSIAVADILIAGIVMPCYFAVSKFSSVPDLRTPFLCKIYSYMWYWFRTVIAYSLVAMVCDRYYRVTKKTKGDNISGSCMFFLSFIWFFAAAYNIWEIVFYTPDLLVTVNDLGVNVTSRRCLLGGPYLYLKHGYIVTDFLVIYLIPLVAIVYMYCVMIKHGCRPRDPRQLCWRRRILLSACLVIMYFVCQLPLEIMNAIFFYNDKYTYKLIKLSKLFETMSFANGVLNLFAFVCCSVELHNNVLDFVETVGVSKHKPDATPAGKCRRRRTRRRSSRKSSGIEVTDVDAIEELEEMDRNTF